MSDMSEMGDRFQDFGQGMSTPCCRPVDWAYEVWDCVVSDLRHKDNHVRAIAGQFQSGSATAVQPGEERS